MVEMPQETSALIGDGCEVPTLLRIDSFILEEAEADALA